LLAIGLNLWLPLRADETPAKVTVIPGTIGLDSTNSVHADLKPSPDSGKIAYYTAKLLEEYQYLKRPFDGSMSTRMFDAYLSSLDPQHLHFLQSDLADFAAYRTNLGKSTINLRHVADTTPAYDIFGRYMKRLKEHVDYVDELLKTEKFDFTSEDRVMLNRHEQAYPKDLAEAKQIWRERLRYEYLMEKVNRETRKTNTLAAAPPVGDLSTTNSDGTTVVPAEKPGTIAGQKPSQPKTMDEEIVEALSKGYHRQLKVFNEYESNDVLTAYLEALARSYDPHSDYEGPAEYEDFAMQMNLSLFGIGAVLQQKDDYVTIAELMSGPAKLSKQIKVGDRIVAVAQSNKAPVDIFGLPINKAVRLIRGPKGTEVRLTIVPAGASDSTRQVVSLVRDEIKLESGEAKGRILEVPDTSGNNVRLGIIDLPSFYATIDAQGNPTPKSTTADVAKLLKKFREQKVAGVILDLRRNGGGSLEEAIRLAGLFIKEGPVVQIRHWDGEVEVREDTDPKIEYAGPLIVMTSRFSASASEIVAGALQDYGRALIVGDTSTFGKGTAQQLFSLAKLPPLAELGHDPGTLKLTNSKFYRASGASTELRGVLADIVLPSLWNDSTEVGENTLDNHLPWDTIESSTYEKVNMVQANLGELAKRSAARVATNTEFAYLREDIARVQKDRADKTVSVNEKQQLKDREDLIAQHKSRETERAKYKVTLPTEYDLTVAQAGQSGLPKANSVTNGVSSPEQSSDSLIPNRINDGDELTEAVGSEGEHADAARLSETENILMDYIQMSKQGLAKSNPVLAK
jgi:carboxyl-terminal processing protease